MPDPQQASHLLSPDDAARELGLPRAAVEALIGGGFLVAEPGPSGPRIRRAELKAFAARNSDPEDGLTVQAAGLATAESDSLDPQDLLDALDGRAEEMARRAFDIFAAAFAEATRWSLSEQAHFIDQAKSRFEAILAVTSQGAAVDEALVEDLKQVGAGAADSGSPLPQLLVILRISRDLVVQTAVEVAEERGQHWGLALSLVLTRVLPAIDRLTDSIAQGYWDAMVRRQRGAQARYEHVVEHSSDGIYEIDLDGRIRYANGALAITLGVGLSELEGALLTDVLVPLDPTHAQLLLSDPPGGAHRMEVDIARADGIRRVLDIRMLTRRDGADGEPVGFQGVVRDETAERELEADRAQFLSMVTSDLRHPISSILGLGATLESHAAELPTDRVAAMARSMRNQAERIARLADDLHAANELGAQSLLLSPRPVDLAQVLTAALASVGGADWVEMRVPTGVSVQADARRLEQALANLVEFVVGSGEPPVAVELEAVLAGASRERSSPGDEFVHLVVTAHGAGVAPEDIPALFAGPMTARRGGTGLGLVRGLVEAMGGRVRYDTGAFRVDLPKPRQRT